MTRVQHLDIRLDAVVNTDTGETRVIASMPEWVAADVRIDLARAATTEGAHALAHALALLYGPHQGQAND